MTHVVCTDAVVVRQGVPSTGRSLVQRPPRSPLPIRSRLSAISVRRWLEKWRARTARLTRSRKTRAEVLRHIRTGQGEQVLRMVCDDAQSWVVATDRALYHQSDREPWPRIGWEQVLRVGWDADRCVLALTVTTARGLRRTTLRIDDRYTMVDLVRERVASTILLSVPVPLGEWWSSGRSCSTTARV